MSGEQGSERRLPGEEAALAWMLEHYCDPRARSQYHTAKQFMDNFESGGYAKGHEDGWQQGYAHARATPSRKPPPISAAAVTLPRAEVRALLDAVRAYLATQDRGHDDPVLVGQRLVELEAAARALREHMGDGDVR